MLRLGPVGAGRGDHGLVALPFRAFFWTDQSGWLDPFRGRDGVLVDPTIVWPPAP